jgi:hypothetical protein
MKVINITYLFLLISIALMALFSMLDASYSFVAILIITFIKFFLVAFYFMELKKAHLFWKISILIFLIAFCFLVLCI